MATTAGQEASYPINAAQTPIKRAKILHAGKQSVEPPRNAGRQKNQTAACKCPALTALLARQQWLDVFLPLRLVIANTCDSGTAAHKKECRDLAVHQGLRSKLAATRMCLSIVETLSTLAVSLIRLQPCKT